jgi:hypothetical protein
MAYPYKLTKRQVAGQIDPDLPAGSELLIPIRAVTPGLDGIDINPAHDSFDYALNTLLYKILLPITLK